MLSEDSDSDSTLDDGIAVLCSLSSNSDSESPLEICSCKPQINQFIEETNYWKAIVEMNRLDISSPSINVLTDDEQQMLNIADQIIDP